ncbi:hypothetical protein PP707_05475, partial [Acetobacter pasteurianus]|nr:hypothetical protein [Acetobacter pasteurianus]
IALIGVQFRTMEMGNNKRGQSFGREVESEEKITSVPPFPLLFFYYSFSISTYIYIRLSSFVS